ncbi:penicillin-binding transpeptidase domain-containing protein [Patescibacteria group bacterium]|nr:penicillin-binding transpeptidase domain-containing protein [Patescibacteria group bacterium]
MATLGILLVRVIDLMVIKHGYYQTLARDNRIIEKKIPAARGEIVDRKGRLIAQSLYQYYQEKDGSKQFVKEGGYEGDRFEGYGQSTELKRHYLYGPSLGLVTGYVGQANDTDVTKTVCGNKVTSDQVIGKSGLEQQFECDLRGTDGKRLVEVDARGSYVRELGRQEPEEGSTLTLSLDAYWQDKIYKLLGGKRAVVVMSEPRTGKILALVSSPSFDPNDFSYEQDNGKITSYLNDHDNLPLLNRAVAGRYHPGSVFKIVISTAGLEEGVITAESTYEDTGIIKLGDYTYTNWLWTKRGMTDGMVNIVKAIQRSNDVFFYKLGGDIGVSRIKKWAVNYGFGNKTGIELPGEQAGIVPDEQWKLDTKGEKWFLGNTYHLSIGQGDLDVTPLQVNEMTNVVANDGTLCAPTLLKDKKSSCRSLGIHNETLKLVKEGMRAACHVGGTAWPLFNFKTLLACKTGTAEVGDGSKDTHAWLTAFAPADDPQISITVMVERGGEGSDVAAPIVGDILKEWFNEPETVVPRYNSDGKVTNLGD